MIGPSIWRWPSIGPGTGSAMRSGPAWSAISCWSPSLARAIPGCSATIAECWSRHDLLCPAPEPLRVGPAGDLRRMLAESLEVPEPALDGAKAFAEHGLNSLLAVRFLDRVNRRFGLRLGVQTLFEHPSLDAFAAFLEPVARQGREIGEPRPALESRPNRDGPSARAPGGDAETEPNAGDIAIIGMAGRFPGADSPAALWSRLAAGELLVREVPPERWSTARFYDPDPAVPHRTVSKWAGLLDGIDRF